MADRTTISAPNSSRQGEVPIGAEVIAGETTGKLRVFDTGVGSFPDLTGLGDTDLAQGFHALTVVHGNGAQSLDVLYEISSTNGLIVFNCCEYNCRRPHWLPSKCRSFY